jgi:membrane-associated protease RseP (regulator of RpoE activity)
VCRFLQQGGALIESVLGTGLLSVPEGALGTPAVAAMTIPLHPVVIAGYISLIVNALSVLPIGTTDGGRMGLALFGRGAKLLIGNVALAALFFVGLSGSDLFLFYFAFCIACQAGNEIPSRNEVDKVGFGRAGVAAGAYALALLSLVPFQ